MSPQAPPPTAPAAEETGVSLRLAIIYRNVTHVRYSKGYAPSIGYALC
jgi:hypothetical protein